MSVIHQVILIVLDSVGIGDAPDAASFGDSGSNTLGNISQAVGGLKLPNMTKLGLGRLGDILGVPVVEHPEGVFGRLTEVSGGKDTTSGHWELAGVKLLEPFPTFPDGFPPEVMNDFENLIGRKTLGNYPASGTEIIKEIGEEHIRTGRPIVYTSADSVFQIAAHEEVIPLNKLYDMCTIARDLLSGEFQVARVIARPFIGKQGDFIRTEGRKDFSVAPPKDTILDRVKGAGLMTAGVGKIEDIFAFRGLTDSNHTGNNQDTFDATIDFIMTRRSGLIFANFIDFDQKFGHRNNPQGYAQALEEFDQMIPSLLNVMAAKDVLFITADHGNDPTTVSTDHSRERVPFLASGGCLRTGADIGTRSSFADVSATIAVMLGVSSGCEGEEFASDILIC